MNDFGTPGRIRTHDLLVRSQALYPAELQGQYVHSILECCIAQVDFRFF